MRYRAERRGSNSLTCTNDMNAKHNPAILDFIDRLAETGSTYRMEEMERLYTEDLGFLVLTPEGEIARFSKAEMMSEFRSRRDAGEKPLSTEKRGLPIGD